jgi:hypothetical protein
MVHGGSQSAGVPAPALTLPPKKAGAHSPISKKCQWFSVYTAQYSPRQPLAQEDKNTK